jgi:hypothetical protein
MRLLVLVSQAIVLLASAPLVGQATADDVVLLQTQPEAAQPSAGGGRSVDVDVDRNGRAWYLNPLWIGIAVVALLLIVVIASLARASGGGGGTTIVKT